MADPTAPPPPYSAASPALPSTADTTPYVPVSWLAVGAAGVTVFFGLLLAILGLIHFRAKRPLIEEELLILSVVAVVLSFAARRVIRNSEGTRTGQLFGIDLPNFAWWGGLVLGLGYISYLLALEYSIRRDAANEMQSWADYVMKGDPESLDRAFYRTQDPSQRKSYSPTDGAKLEARWGKDYTAFRQSDIVRLTSRSPGAKFEAGGLRDWQFKSGVECSFTGKITCAEGTFPVLVQMKGFESVAGGETAGRQWQIQPIGGGYIEKEKVSITPYGWLVQHLAVTGGEYGRSFINMSSGAREVRALAWLDYVKTQPGDATPLAPLTNGGAQARAAATGVMAAYSFTPGPEFLAISARRLFTLPNGAAPDSDQFKTFETAWNTVGIVRAGERLRDSADTTDELRFTPEGVENRIPIEIPFSSTRADISAARGRLVVRCDDPEILSELKKLRDSADPAQGSSMPPTGLVNKRITWRVVRIESDLKPVRMDMRAMGPGGPPPGSPPGQ
jgi:hypothetical protein